MINQYKSELQYAVKQQNHDKFFQLVFQAIAKPAIAIAQGRLKDYLNSRHDIEPEDVIQTVMLRVLEKGFDHFKDRNPEEIERYIRRAVHRECLNIIRQNRVSTLVDAAEKQPILEESATSGAFEQSDLTRQLFTGLSAIEQRMVHLRITGHTFKEISALLNMAETTVKDRFNKAKDLIEKNKRSNEKQEAVKDSS